jgi:hypothetical protein
MRILPRQDMPKRTKTSRIPGMPAVGTPPTQKQLARLRSAAGKLADVLVTLPVPAPGAMYPWVKDAWFLALDVLNIAGRLSDHEEGITMDRPRPERRKPRRRTRRSDLGNGQGVATTSPKNAKRLDIN